MYITYYYGMTALFDDRIQAGEQLADALKEYFIHTEDNSNELDIEKIKQTLIVLAIPRGGIILGDVIASKFHCNLDMVIPKKIGAPFNKELAIGAVMPGGTYFINEYYIELLSIPQKYVQNEVQHQMNEIRRRLREFRGSDTYDSELEGKIVVLVDDGIATGATIIAAAQWIKEEKHQCKKLIIAIPVAPGRDEIMDKLNQIADKVIILHAPIDFDAVGQFYSEFDQVVDEEVKAIMKKYRKSVT